MKKIVLAAILFTAATTVAQADDFNWAGWYVGGEVGKSQVTANWTSTQAFLPTGVPYTGVAAPNEKMKSAGKTEALVVGRNWLVAPKWVAGAEFKMTLAKQSSQINSIPGLNPVPGPNYSTSTVKAGNGFALSAKGGYLLTPETMLDASLGLAYQKFTASTACYLDINICNSPSYPPVFTSSSKNLLGWTLGLGGEYAFTAHWTARLDYVYTSFKSYNFVAMHSNPFFAFGSNASIKPTSQALSAGVSYKF